MINKKERGWSGAYRPVTTQQVRGSGATCSSVHPFCQVSYLWYLQLSLSCFFQGKNKFCAHPGRTDHIDILPMGKDDLLYDGESKSGAFAVFSPGNICFIEPLPDLRNAFFRNTCAVVFYGYEDLSFFSVVSIMMEELS